MILLVSLLLTNHLIDDQLFRGMKNSKECLSSKKNTSIKIKPIKHFKFGNIKTLGITKLVHIKENENPNNKYNNLK